MFIRHWYLIKVTGKTERGTYGEKGVRTNGLSRKNNNGCGEKNKGKRTLKAGR